MRHTRFIRIVVSCVLLSASTLARGAASDGSSSASPAPTVPILRAARATKTEAELLDRAQHGDLEAAARLVQIGAWESLSALASSAEPEDSAVRKWSESSSTALGLAAAEIAGACHLERAFLLAERAPDEAKAEADLARRLLGETETLEPLLQARLSRWLQSVGERKASRNLAKAALESLRKDATAADRQHARASTLEAGRLELLGITGTKNGSRALSAFEEVRIEARGDGDLDQLLRVLDLLARIWEEEQNAVTTDYYAAVFDERAVVHATRGTPAAAAEDRERAARCLEQGGKYQQAFQRRQAAVEFARSTKDPRLLGTALEAVASVLSNDDRLTLPEAELAASVWAEASIEWKRAGETERAVVATLESAAARTWTNRAGLEQSRGMLEATRPVAGSRTEPQIAALSALVEAWIRCAAADPTSTDVAALFVPAVELARASRSTRALGRALRARGRYLLPENSAFADVELARAALSQAAQEFETCGDFARAAESLDDIARSLHPGADPVFDWDRTSAAYQSVANAWLRVGRFERCAALGLVGLRCKVRGDWSSLPETEIGLLDRFGRFAERGGDRELARECRQLYLALLGSHLPGQAPDLDPSARAGGPCHACGGAGHFPQGVFGPQPLPCLSCNMTGRSK